MKMVNVLRVGLGFFVTLSFACTTQHDNKKIEVPKLSNITDKITLGSDLSGSWVSACESTQVMGGLDANAPYVPTSKVYVFKPSENWLSVSTRTYSGANCTGDVSVSEAERINIEEKSENGGEHSFQTGDGMYTAKREGDNIRYSASTMYGSSEGVLTPLYNSSQGAFGLTMPTLNSSGPKNISISNPFGGVTDSIKDLENKAKGAANKARDGADKFRSGVDKAKEGREKLRGFKPKY